MSGGPQRPPQPPQPPDRPARRLGDGLTPMRRRVLQAALYEAIALAVLTPLLSWWFGQGPASTLLLTVLMSAIAMGWNFAFNAAFERWEARHPVGGRPWHRRVLHGVGFEAGLAAMLVPLMAAWLDIGLWQALVADALLVLGFMFYTLVFTWGFDQVFGLPESARATAPAATPAVLAPGPDA